MTFDEWYERLKIYSQSEGFGDYVISSDQACWLDFYNDGMTPKEALDEDLSYAD